MSRRSFGEVNQTSGQANVIQSTKRHNMATHPDESYYLRQYWHWIEKVIMQIPETIKNYPILDLGCGQGRISLPLIQKVKKYAKVTGVDISVHALDFARKSIADAGLENQCEFIESDIFSYLQNQFSNQFQLVVCTEVFFILPNYKQVCREVARVLAPGGVFLPAFRSKYFNILYSIKERYWSALKTLQNNCEGHPWGYPNWFSWHTVEQTRSILENSGFDISACRGIGICSGIEGDPLDGIAKPSLLTKKEQADLMEIELALASDLANCGRYILIEATKKPDSF